MNRILVAYATMAGSTAEVAQAVRDELVKCGFEVDLQPLSQVKELEGYDGVVIGAPMIMGWHREALRFLKRHRSAFQRIPLAVFVLAMSLTQTGKMTLDSVSVCVDEDLPKPPQTDGRLSYRERYARLHHYLEPILQAVRPANPVSVGVFGGRLEYGRLKWWAVLFAMLIIQAPPGERRNWSLIRAWAAGLPDAFHLVPEKPGELQSSHHGP